ncbi:unnamed protein product [Gordionus sp. m RMFG-2023]|uniref:replication protein A 70 kDa DNA-binding subunit-like n=1 Tax=Gordionus sp. m RMFG-2023 TaxID=3053472 RepID=UPI0030E2A25E
MNSLTPNSIQDIIKGDNIDKPIVQLLGLKKMAGADISSDRYRLLLSDGKNCTTSVLLANQLNDLITSGKLENYAIIRLDKYLCNNVNNEKRILVVLELSIVKPGNMSQKIGNPEPYKQTNENQTVNNSLDGNPTKKARNNSQNIGPINPIASLSPYQNRWIIKARVTNKSNIRTWSNSKGEGKLFSFDLLDESSEIRVTCFNQECDNFYSMIEAGKVYYISRATLKAANKSFSSIKNDYEITLNSDSSVTPCYDEIDDIPNIQYNFIPINEILTLEKDIMIDVIAVILSASDIQTIISRNMNKEIKKRDLVIADQTMTSINLTMWGADAENLVLPPVGGGEEKLVIAVKSARLTDFNGRSLSLTLSSSYQIDPDISECAKLKEWYMTQGHLMKSSIVHASESNIMGSSVNGVSTDWKFLHQIKDENLGQGDKPDYLMVKATVEFFKKENSMYQACPSTECNKKVVDMNNGKYRCEKCQKDYDNFKWRLILSVNIADFSGSQWVMAFQEAAEMLLETTAETLGDLKNSNEALYDEKFQNGIFKSYIFKLRAKVETFNEETRLKVTCMSAKPVNFSEYNKRLIDEITKLSIK